MCFVFPNLSVNLCTISTDNKFYLYRWTVSKEAVSYFSLLLLWMWMVVILCLISKKKKGGKGKKKLLQSSIFMLNCIFKSAQHSAQCPLHLWPVCADVIARSSLYLGQKYPLAFWQDHLQCLFVTQPLQFISLLCCRILSFRICIHLDS